MKNPCQARVFTLLSFANLRDTENINISRAPYEPGCLALGDVLWSVHGKSQDNTRVSFRFINHSCELEKHAHHCWFEKSQ